MRRENGIHTKSTRNLPKVTQAIGDSKSNVPKAIGVTFRFANNCNQTCSYCQYKDNAEGIKETEHYINMVDEVLGELGDKESIYVYIHGGEPTLLPLLSIVHHIQSYRNVKDIIVNTNSSRPIEYYEQFTDLLNFSFALSYQHHQRRNEDFKVFYDKAGYLLCQGLLNHVNFSLEPDNIDEIIPIVQELGNDILTHKVIYNYINVDPVLYASVKEIVDAHTFDYKAFCMEVYTADGYVRTFKNYNALRQAGFNRFKFFKCTAGGKNIVIEPDGSIYYCLSHQSAGKPKGSIYTEGDVKEITSTESIFCMWDICQCELWLEKVRVFDESIFC